MSLSNIHPIPCDQSNLSRHAPTCPALAPYPELSFSDNTENTSNEPLSTLTQPMQGQGSHSIILLAVVTHGGNSRKL